MEWSDWIQSVAGGVIGKAADAQFVQPYETEKLRLQALGSAGYYTEGQRTATGTAANAMGLGGVNPMVWVALGVGVVALLVLRD